MKKIALFSVSLALCATSVFAAAPYDNQGNQTVCVSEQNYGVDPVEGSKYVWSVTKGTAGTDFVLNTTEGDKTSVNWLKQGTFELNVQETDKNDCVGPLSTITVEVSPLPEVDEVETTMCSNNAENADAKVEIELPTKGSNGVTVNKWVIKDVVVPTGVTAGANNVAVGTELSSAAGIANDTYTNAGTATAVVEYVITPYAGDCKGADDFVVKVNVLPNLTAPTIFREN